MRARCAWLVCAVGVRSLTPWSYNRSVASSALVAELARQCSPQLATVATLAVAAVEIALTRFSRRGASQKFHEMGCRLDRERLDCIVLKTHFAQLSSALFHGRDRQVTSISRRAKPYSEPANGFA